MKTHAQISAFESLEQRRLLAGDISGTVSVLGTPVAGRSVYIDLNLDGVRDSNEPQTFTGAAGFYTFSGLATGTYRVTIDISSDVALVSPASHAVNLDSANEENIDFNLTPVSEGVTDANDTLGTATPLGDLVLKATVRGASLDTDVDLYSFTATGGIPVAFHLKGEGDHILRIFNSAGQQISSLPTSGPYEHLVLEFSQPGTYYVGVSTSGNRNYNPQTGSGDTADTQNVPLGDYTLTLQKDGDLDVDVDDGDFNNDDIADFFVRNNTTGSNQIWLRNADGVSLSKIDLPPAASPWRAVALSDFDGDGHTDILFRNANTGISSVWLMRDGVLRGFRGLSASTLPVWRLVDATNFNADGNADLLWHNTTTGQVLVQFMNGRVASGYKTLGVVGSSWRLGGASEFDTDGDGDLIWRNTANGKILRWDIDHLSIRSFITIDSRTDQNWQIVGVNEYGDETEDYDLLWRNATTGENQIWYYLEELPRAVSDLPSIAGADIDVIG